jgi:hypothetical protein
VLAVRAGLRSTLRVAVDYMIAAAAAALVFGYLVDALLRPEKY